MIIIDSSDLDLYVEKTCTDPNFKGSMPTPLSFVLDNNKRTYGRQFMHVCKESLYYHQFVIYFQKNSYLVPRVNQIMGMLFSNGLISLWEKQTMNMKYFNGPSKQKEPKQLTYGHISGGLWILFIGILSGFLVFVLEIISMKVYWLKNIFDSLMKS